MKLIDLRSDTVTQPSEGMRIAMANAVVGDDVYGEDTTVIRLQDRLAEMAGKEAGLFVPSGTQSNLLALLSHCQRGDEYVAGQCAHIYKYEAGGGAVLGSIQPQPIDNESDATLSLEKIQSVIKEKDSHFANTKLLCIENTMGGRALPMAYLSQLKSFAFDKKLSTHLDGARVFNAMTKHQVDLQAITACFDSVSICMSKGLGAPVGSVLCGSKAFIEEAHRWRKMVGGGMRQAGILAEACLYALDHNIDRLTEDQDNAAILAEGLNQIEQISVEYDHQQTNMVFARISEEDVLPLQDLMTSKSIILSIDPYMRMVTHMDVTEDDIRTVIDAFKTYYKY